MTLTNFPYDPLLDLAPWVGQRQATFRFDLTNGATGEVLGEINPIRQASLTHDTTKTIKRQLTLSLGKDDTDAIDMVADRVSPYMVFGNGTEYPLGRYVFSDASKQLFTSGRLSNATLSDEMFIIDQPMSAGISALGRGTQATIDAALSGLDVDLVIEGGSFQGNQAWSAGTNRGAVLEALSVSGDYFSPWFGNDTKLHFIRTFEPADEIPDFDFDASNKVLRESIVETSNLLTAPNRFIAISNSFIGGATSALGNPLIGVYDIPRNAPNSIANRGFVIAQVQDVQALNQQAISVVARNIGIRNTVFETTTLTTVPDPRHDSYNVIKWQGALWLELAWSMAMTEGGTMTHTLRKSYT